MFNACNPLVRLTILSLAAAAPAVAAPIQAASPAATTQAAATVARATLQRYVGSYTSPIDPVRVALDESGSLAVTLGQQPAVPIRPLSDTEFEAPSVNARVTFELENGAVTRVVIRQGERQLSAERVKE